MSEVERANNRAIVLAKETKTLRELLDRSKASIATALPRHLTPDKMIKLALVAVSKSELLQQCTVNSILQCVMTGAQLGLDCSGVLGSAYMVPFFNSKIGAYEAVFIPGYRGLIDLARRSDQIDDIFAQVVYADDEFTLEYGSNPRIDHKPNLEAGREDEKIIGAYMVAWVKGCTRPHIEFITRADIEKIRKASKAAFDRAGNPKGPWRDWFAEMCRKTAVRRGVKYLPMSVELAEAIEADTRAQNPQLIDVVDVSGTSRSAALAEKIKARELPAAEEAPAPESSEPPVDAPGDEPGGEGDKAPEKSPEPAPEPAKAPAKLAFDAFKSAVDLAKPAGLSSHAARNRAGEVLVDHYQLPEGTGAKAAWDGLSTEQQVQFLDWMGTEAFPWAEQ